MIPIPKGRTYALQEAKKNLSRSMKEDPIFMEFFVLPLRDDDAGRIMLKDEKLMQFARDYCVRYREERKCINAFRQECRDIATFVLLFKDLSGQQDVTMNNDRLCYGWREVCPVLQKHFLTIQQELEKYQKLEPTFFLSQ